MSTFTRFPSRRHVLWTLAAAPVGCAIRPLAPLATQTLATPPGVPLLRPPQVGQAWTYRQINHFNSVVLAEVQDTVTAVAMPGEGAVVERRAGTTPLPAERHSTWGQLLRDPVWDYPLNLEQPVPLWPKVLQPGQTQRVHTHYREDGGSYRYWVQVHASVVGWERVTVAAGTFDTVRVARLVRLQHRDVNRLETLRRDVLWLAPEVGRWVVRDTSGRYREPDGEKLGGTEYREDHFRWELAAWR